MSARDAVLAAVRAALAASPAPDLDTPAPAYRRQANLGVEERIARFLDRLGDYQAHIEPVAGTDAIAAAIAARLAARNLSVVAVAADFPPAWRPLGVSLIEDTPALSNPALDGVPGALTAAACAIAETGTVALDTGAGQGRRALTLLPDYHLCVVLASQVVDGVPEALAALKPAAQAGRPLTFFSGPSATADIEFDRVVGVHGPRVLDVIFVDDLSPAG